MTFAHSFDSNSSPPPHAQKSGRGLEMGSSQSVRHPQTLCAFDFIRHFLHCKYHRHSLIFAYRLCNNCSPRLLPPLSPSPPPFFFISFLPDTLKSLMIDVKFWILRL